MPQISFIILAGGSEHRTEGGPKSLIEVRGRAAIEYALDLAETFGPTNIWVVCGSGDFTAVKRHVAGRAEVLEQTRPLGSGHAVGVALERVSSGEVWVSYADRVLLSGHSLRRLAAACTPATVAAILSVHVQKPAGYARIVRDERARVLRATGDCELARPGDAAIREVVAGAYWFDAKALKAAIIPPGTLDRKYNLTESVGEMIRAGGEAVAVALEDANEALGVYSQARARMAEAALEAGLAGRSK